MIQMVEYDFFFSFFFNFLFGNINIIVEVPQFFSIVKVGPKPRAIANTLLGVANKAFP